jgi:proteasome lid subunit RPN8/RPN11
MPSVHIDGLPDDQLAGVLDALARRLRPPAGLDAGPPGDPEAALLMSRPCHDHVLRELTSRPPEAGGLLLGPRDHRAVTHFVLDETGAGTPASFTFDHERLNALLAPLLAAGLDVKGLVHSHPDGCDRLSAGDLAYARRLLRNPRNDAEAVLMPIVVAGTLLPFVVRRECWRQPERVPLVLF